MDQTWAPAALDPRVVKALELAHHDIGRVRESPMGSNRSPRIDVMNRTSGSPLGSYWCANAVAAWWREAGLAVPPREAGSCDRWMAWGIETRRWSKSPAIGAAVVYGPSKADANHIGIVFDIDGGTVFSIEGNTTLDGYSRNGEVVTLKIVRPAKVLGYVLPFPLAP